MENPVAIVKSNLSIGKILGWLILAWVVFAILDVLKVTPFILYPVTALKAKFGSATPTSSTNTSA